MNPRRRIRLCHVITDLQVGGVPLHLARLISSLSVNPYHNQYDIQVISLADVGPIGADIRNLGIPVHACQARGPWDIRALGRLYGLLRAFKPDLIHSLLFHANMAVRVVAPLVGVPVSRILNEIQTVEIERRWHLWLDNLSCRLCRREIGNSPSVVRHLNRQAHIPFSRLKCVLGAIDVPRFANAKPMPREQVGIPDNRPILIWTGRLDPVKGFEDMLGAFARICDRLLCHLVLVGEGPYRAKIETMLERHPWKDNIHLLGSRNDIPALLKMADLFVFCSKTEGLPNSVLEAMAAGRAVVAMNVPGPADIITTGQNGILVPPGKIDAFARAVVNLLECPTNRTQIAESAQKWVSRHTNNRDLAAKWHSIYGNILMGKQGPHHL